MRTLARDSKLSQLDPFHEARSYFVNCLRSVGFFIALPNNRSVELAAQPKGVLHAITPCIDLPGRARPSCFHV